MPKKGKSLEWKLRPFVPGLKLGAYEINSKSTKKLGPELARMVKEKGQLHLDAIEHPLATFAQKRDKIRILFSAKERHTMLAEAIKRKLLLNVEATKLAENEESALTEVVQMLTKLGEDQLLSLLEKQKTLTRKDFVSYLIAHKSMLFSQQEFNLRQQELEAKQKSLS